MLIEILIAILCGITCGIFTGLIPGIHINLISLIVLTMSPVLLQYTSPFVIGTFIIAMSVTHTFIDSIPGIYLGAPDESMAMAALPGHRMLIKGKGHVALSMTVIGSYLSLLLCILLSPLLMMVVGMLYPVIRDKIGWILITIMAYMILKDKKRKWNFVIFFMSGILGMIVLDMGVENVLFPLLSGLFGFSILIFSLKQSSTIPRQELCDAKVDGKTVAKATIGATTVGFLASFLPGFGSSQAAIIATQFLRDIGDKGFLILVGGINTVNMTLSLITLYVIEKARNGSVLTISKIVQYDAGVMASYLAVSLIVGSVAVMLALVISKAFSALISKVNYVLLVSSVLIFIAVLVLFLSGMIGVVILLTATGVGLLATSLSVGKNHCMGCLILPVILYFI